MEGLTQSNKIVGLLWLSFPICRPVCFTFSLVSRLRRDFITKLTVVRYKLKVPHDVLSFVYDLSFGKQKFRVLVVGAVLPFPIQPISD